MADSWENLISQREMVGTDFFGQCHMNSFYDEKYLTDLSLESNFSLDHSPCPSSTTQSSTAAAAAPATTTIDSRHSSNSMIISHDASQKLDALSPATYTLSFGNLTVEPAVMKPSTNNDSALKFYEGQFDSVSERILENQDLDPKVDQGTRKLRSSSGTPDHIMAERERRQGLTERFVPLSAAIPGSKEEMVNTDFFGQCHMNSFYDEKYLTDLSLESIFSLDHSPYPSSTTQSGTTVAAAATTIDSSNRSNSMIISHDASQKPDASSPTTYTLSFGNPTVEPAVMKPSTNNVSALKLYEENFDSVSERTLENHDLDPKVNQGTKKLISSSGTPDHIMADRKRRQELTEKFVELSATIPALKKTDKTYILGEAIKFVKQLQERVEELENQNERTTADSVLLIEKSHVCTNETITCETDFGSCSRFCALPEVQARVLEKQVLIGIHCEKQEDILLKIVALLKNHHLSLVSGNVLPFGTSTLKVTIIAQMGDRYCMKVNDLAKNLRRDILKSHDMQH